MIPDESEGEIIWMDHCSRVGIDAETGGHHMFLQTTAGVMQRKMDADSLTPVDIWIGSLEPYSWNYHGEEVKCMARVTKVIFRPGKSDVSFKQWLMGIKGNE